MNVSLTAKPFFIHMIHATILNMSDSFIPICRADQEFMLEIILQHTLLITV